MYKDTESLICVVEKLNKLYVNFLGVNYSKDLYTKLNKDCVNFNNILKTNFACSE